MLLLGFLDENGNYLSKSYSSDTSNPSVSATPPSMARYLIASCNRNQNQTHLQLEQSQAQVQPDNSLVVKRTLPQKMFFGSFDPFYDDGQCSRVVFSHGEITLNGSEAWTAHGSLGNWFQLVLWNDYDTSDGVALSSGESIESFANWLTQSTVGVTGNMPLNTFGFATNSYNNQRLIVRAQFSSLSDFTAYLAEHPLQIVYRYHYEKTSVVEKVEKSDVITLDGENHFMTPNGITTVTYTRDTKMTIESAIDTIGQLIAPIETIGIAHQNYSSGDLVILNGGFLSQLVRMTSNVSSGSWITVGENAEEVTLSEIL
jgi:hypothetical protein